MDQKVIAFNQQIRASKSHPELRVGDIVRVHKRIKEGEKERVQVFKGLIIAIKGGQSSSPMVTVRRESQKIGVEMTFPLYLESIEKVEVLRHSKVRRQKLYYMRERSGKSAKMKVINLSEEEKKKMEEIYAKPPKKEVGDENTESSEKK
jgi:large subunit ribosomal protein L19